MFERLPKPNANNGYFFHNSKATILPSSLHLYKWIAADHEGMPLTDGPGLRLFESASEALEFLRVCSCLTH
jgi:hypothetical protein